MTENLTLNFLLKYIFTGLINSLLFLQSYDSLSRLKESYFEQVNKGDAQHTQTNYLNSDFWIQKTSKRVKFAKT